MRQRADSKYFQAFITQRNAVKYELVTNYRSKRNLVDFANGFAATIRNRLKVAPISAFQQDNGSIRLFRYQNKHLITPLLEDLRHTGLSGATCVLTKTNDEAFQIAGLLRLQGMPVRLIQGTEDFQLINLLEIRGFLHYLKLEDATTVIHEDIWEMAKKALKQNFPASSVLEMVFGLIGAFESVNGKRRYKSDLLEFVRESKMEDFYKATGETIFVSTIHKAKGKEFDNIFLLLEDFNTNTDESRRQLYVALTRAKKNLTIHTNVSCFDHFQVADVVHVEKQDQYTPPARIARLVGYKDLYLGYFSYVQHRIQKLTSGDALKIHAAGLSNQNNELVLKFSHHFLQELERYKNLGYEPIEAKVHFIVIWKHAQRGEDTRVVLPEIVFGKVGVS